MKHNNIKNLDMSVYDLLYDKDIKKINSTFKKLKKTTKKARRRDEDSDY